MIDFSAIDRRSLLGRALRAPLALIPSGAVVPVLQGPLRGARWIVGSATHGCWLGCYEWSKQRTCVAHVRPGMAAYDLGANVGFYTLLFSRLVGDHGAVHAFEPSERNLRALRRHVGMNRAANVGIHGVAVGARSGSAGFDAGLGPSMGRIVADPIPSGVRVPVVSLDDFVYLDGYPAPDLVKMDVEGAEADVLAGMQKLLVEARPTILVAVHGTDRWHECYERLVGAGYRVRDLDGAPVGAGVARDEIVAVPEG